jgi:plasmid stability protein
MTLTIHGLDEAVEKKLRIQAANHGRSVEAEAREILMVAVIEPDATVPATANTRPPSVCDSVRGIWKGLGTTDEMMRELRGED